MASARLFRVILPVNDIDASATFYSALLDDASMRVSPGRHYFDCGGVVLALYSPRSDGDDRTPRPNWDHVYLAVNDLPAVFERARKAGGARCPSTCPTPRAIRSASWTPRRCSRGHRRNYQGSFVPSTYVGSTLFACVRPAMTFMSPAIT